MTQELKAPGTNREHITHIPLVDVYTRGEETILVADMPGVDEKTVEAMLDDNILTITGTRHIDVPAGFSTVRQENAPTEYRRTFEVSHEIDRNKIRATVKNGVLRVVLPRDEETKPRKISISSE